MNTTSLSWCFACVIVCCQIFLSLAAPALSREKRHVLHDGETRLSLIVDSNADPQDLFAQTDEAEDAAHTRNKRHAQRHAQQEATADEGDLDVDLTLPDEGDVSPSVRRRRSTAAFWLHASLQLCNRFVNYCRRIEVDEGDVKIKLRLEDE